MKYALFIFVAIIATFTFSSRVFSQDDIYFSRTRNSEVRSQKDQALKSKFTSHSDSITYHDILSLSGRYLQKSSTFDYVAIGSAAAGGILAGVGATMDKIDDARPFYIAGAALGIAAIASRIISISYKSKSGKTLQFYPTNITYIF